MPRLLLLLNDSPPASPLASGWVPIVLIGAIFWFVVIAPERKQRREREAMLAALKKGDEVLTTGGQLGKITQIQDDVVTVQVADGVRVRFLRSAIGSLRSGSGEGSASAS